jgi:hypothetical protein
MARGGKRPNAGRKAGTPNKASIERQAKISASGLTPLDYMLKILRDEDKPVEARMDAAKAAAPYVHPRLAAVELKGDADNPITTVNRIELVPLDANTPD